MSCSVVLLLTLCLCANSVSAALSTSRTLARFTKGDPENERCWDRESDDDGFFSVYDSHNHFHGFGGPAVPFDMYVDWITSHGLVFTTMFGIGQKIDKKRDDLKDCCYYLHCPSLDYPVEPTDDFDRINAANMRKHNADEEARNRLHLTLSATFVNLQNTTTNKRVLNRFLKDFPGQTRWFGEINVFKHALAANGFFHNDRVTVDRIARGEYDHIFHFATDKKWPVTLHCDLGCDNYDSIPSRYPHADQQQCVVPPEEITRARRNYRFWKDFLAEHYYGFFTTNNEPIPSQFSKIQHLEVWNAILKRYPNMITVWAHTGMSKELQDLHPLIHAHILTKLFKMYPNLYTDISWDVLPKTIYLNYNSAIKPGYYSHENHGDLDVAAAKLFNKSAIVDLRNELEELWSDNKDLVHETGSANVILGPTYKFAMYLQIFNEFSDRFITGTDFVATYGNKKEYPGLKRPPTGCMKDKANHARQLTDTSAINMFLNDTAFSQIVLGGNYFKLAGIDGQYQAPPLCPPGTSSAFDIENDWWWILLIVLLVILLLVLLAVGLFFFMKKRNN